MQAGITTRSGRRPSQHPQEIQPFIQLLIDSNVKSYLEIGARHGDTFYDVMTALPKGSVGVAVDLAGGAWGVESSKAHLERVCDDLSAMGYKITLIFGDSTSEAVIERVRQFTFDAMLIDGDHRYGGVKADWLNYGDLAPIVAFHDIDGEGIVHPKQKVAVEVPRLWKEIKKVYTTKEFIHKCDKPMGIGVVLR